MIDKRLVVHHVGGRSGSRGFPLFKDFENDVINVLYEANDKCIEQIEKRWANEPSQTVVLPYCLSDSKGSITFNLNYDPYTSSIYPFNEKYGSFYLPKVNCDYQLGETHKTMEKVHVSTLTLDDMLSNEDRVSAPDFLSIDTQGSELRILKGGSKL